MNKNSNIYTFIYASVLVVIVAFLLAFVSQSLKAKQDRNVLLDEKKQILYSLNIRGLDDESAEKKYEELIDTVDNVFKAVINGEEITILPLKGMGLWGPISGYISLYGEPLTVYGAYFNHESETAGLGAEIKDSQRWQEQFQNKKIFKEGVDGVALSVEKTVDDPTTQVNAVTGATLTSNGVRDMLKNCITQYIQSKKEK